VGRSRACQGTVKGQLGVYEHNLCSSRKFTRANYNCCKQLHTHPNSWTTLQMCIQLFGCVANTLVRRCRRHDDADVSPASGSCAGKFYAIHRKEFILSCRRDQPQGGNELNKHASARLAAEHSAHGHRRGWRRGRLSHRRGVQVMQNCKGPLTTLLVAADCRLGDSMLHERPQR